MQSIFTWIRERFVRLYFDNRNWASLKEESHRDDLREAKLVFDQAINVVLKTKGSQLQTPEPTRLDLNWIMNRQKRRAEVLNYFSQFLMNTDNENRCFMHIKKTSLKYSLNEIKSTLLSAAKIIDPANENEVNAIAVAYTATTFILNDNDFSKEKIRALVRDNLLIIGQPGSPITTKNLEAIMKTYTAPGVDQYGLAFNIQEVRKVTSTLSATEIHRKFQEKENPFD
jgi:hypothetical protein